MKVRKLQRNWYGKVRLPSSKSIANRLLILRALSQGALQIKGLSQAKDTVLLAKNLDEVLSSDEYIFNLDLNNCGTCVRFLTAYLAIRPGIYIINGDARMQDRPIGPLVDALRDLGANIAYVNKEGFLPLYISGSSLRGGSVEIDARMSSQFVSALMLIAPAMQEGLHLKLKGLASAPYLEMTYLLMKRLGLSVEKLNGLEYKIPAQKIGNKRITVSADWSSASFWYGFVSLADEAELFVYGLEDCGLQGDRVLYRIYEDLGVNTEFTSSGALLRKRPVNVFHFEMDLQDYPDIALPLIVNLVLSGISFRLSGLAHLRYKESDRLAALQKELAKIGAYLEIDDNGTVWWKKSELYFPQGLVFDTYKDHRIAMSLAQVAMFGDIEIVDGENVVKKSYPDFWHNLSSFYSNT